MQRILLTGMSGVGKSTVAAELGAAGYRSIDLDDPAWSAWVESADGDGPSPLMPGRDWVWQEDRVRLLLDTDRAAVLFVSGCAPNQAQFHHRFDHVVLLSAPAAVMVERLTRRSANEYGKNPEELARSLRFKQTVEPLLRSVADVEIDTSAPLTDVVAAVLELVG